MTFINTFLTALRGIAANKLRAALTALGVTIGVASVIATLALGNGARAAVEAAFRFLGSNEIQISPKYTMDEGELVPAGKPLTYEDGLLMPESVELVERVEMSVHGSGKVRHGRVVLDMSITGVTADALETVISRGEVQPVGWPEGEPLSPASFIGQGRFFTPAEVLDNAAVCVLGHQTAEDLFEGDDPLGEPIWINHQRCMVIGVLVELETIDPAERYHSRPNEALYVPIGVAIHNLYDSEPSVMITARVSDESRMDEAKAQVAAYLRQRHGIEEPPPPPSPYEEEGGEDNDDFFLTTKQDILGRQQEAARTFSLLLTALAVVSLVVGGIGIMNVMLVSVTERTREIGVRMAVGARRRDVVIQFLLEAVLLSAVSGMVGIALGVLTIPLAALLNQGMALLDPASIPLSLGVALMTGVVFGLYPALRASRLNPIEALRYE